MVLIPNDFSAEPVDKRRASLRKCFACRLHACAFRMIARREQSEEMALAQPAAAQRAPIRSSWRSRCRRTRSRPSSRCSAALLLDNQAFDRVADLVGADDFYRDDHRRIWRHIARLIEANRPADVVTVAESIEASEDKDKTGGAAYLGALAQNTPSALNIRRYAELVRERSVQRRLAQVATEIAEDALNPAGQGSRAAARRGRVEDLPDRRVGRAPRPGPARDQAGAGARVRAHRPPLPPRQPVRRHRRADRLRRPRPDDRRPAAAAT